MIDKIIKKIQLIINRPIIDKNCKIGDFTYIGENCRISKATIGRYCSIAPNVLIGQGEHLIDSISTSAYFVDNPYDEFTKKDVFIGNDVWIGNNVIVLRGVKIGNGAVIGAGSVVTKDVDNFSISVGVPAKHFRYRFNKEKIKIIEDSDWWNFDITTAQKIMKKMKDEWDV